MLLATHDGTFHADEALALFLLKLLPAYRDATVLRTRDASLLATADIVVDVGGEYDPSRHRYDHHQRGFNETFDAVHTVTKLSSAGLVYKHFGREAVAQVLGWEEGDERVGLVYAKVYDDLIEGFDGVDNGVERYPAEVKARYKEGTSVARRVQRLNPWWNEKGVDVNERFKKAMEITGEEFTSLVRYLGLSWLPARSMVEEGVKNRKSVHPSGRIILFDSFCPWKEHLFQIERELSLKDDERIFYAIYPDESGKWRVQCVPEHSDSFVSRKPLPEAWRGVRDDALSKVTGIPGCVFVHASGFIGGNQTKDGALKMAFASLDM
ncbi:hypothetical protein HDU96_002485 [Phlyctochytrium bullatum]|nr:hypothetical protein HDU96_002485 [Phlyctochytrium bullatum]